MLDDENENKGALKRLWWCCILRDRIMALGLRRPMCIRPMDCDSTLPGLTENDFEDEIRYSGVYSPAIKRKLIQIIVSASELGVILSDVLDIIYPMKPASHQVYCKQIHDQLQILLASLDNWYEKTMTKSFSPNYVTGTHRSVILFTNMVYMYY